MSSDDATTAWASVPWAPVDDVTGDDKAGVLGWRKTAVPYVPNAVELQTLDVWVPGTGPDAPSDASLPASRPGPWLICIHGGAWRDPRVSSASFDATARHLLARARTGDVAFSGMASLNYRLSTYTYPNAGPNPDRAPDAAKEARHPDHIADVLSALAFLQALGAAPAGYVLSGHSCGATLAFQAVMASTRWGPGLASPTKPAVVVGLNGLYDLADFVENPPAAYAGLQGIYKTFTRGAFGDEVAGWRAACPTTAGDWAGEWEGGRRAVLVQSREDTLVPYNQLEGLRAHLQGAPFEVVELEAGGDHDMWEDGERTADVLGKVLQDMKGLA